MLGLDHRIVRDVDAGSRPATLLHDPLDRLERLERQLLGDDGEEAFLRPTRLPAKLATPNPPMLVGPDVLVARLDLELGLSFGGHCGLSRDCGYARRQPQARTTLRFR